MWDIREIIQWRAGKRSHLPDKRVISLRKAGKKAPFNEIKAMYLSEEHKKVLQQDKSY